MVSSRRAKVPAYGALACTLGFSALLMSGTLIHAQGNPLLLAILSGGYGGGMHSSGQGYLGVRLRTVGDPSTSALRLKEVRGVVVIVVDHDGPAWKAGIRENDVVTSLNGTAIDTQDQLSRMLREMAPGRSVQIVISRDGVPQTITAVMADRDEVGKRAWEQHWVVPAPTQETAENLVAPSPPPAARSSRGFGRGFVSGHLLPTSTPYIGAEVDEVGTQLAEYFGLKGGTGLLVHNIDANSPAAAAGLHAGDVITHVNGAAMNTLNDWNRALHDSKGHPVSVMVMREHREQILTVVPEGKRRSSVEDPGRQNGWLASVLHQTGAVNGLASGVDRFANPIY